MFRLFRLEPRAWRIRAYVPRPAGVNLDESFDAGPPDALWAPGVEGLSQAQVVALAPGQEVSDVTIRYGRQQSAWILAHVVDSAGEPMKGATVLLSDECGRERGRTDDAGLVALQAVPTTACTVTARPNADGTGPREEGRVVVSVAVDDDTHVTIQTASGLEAHGMVQVQGRPVGGSNIEVLAMDTRSVESMIESAVAAVVADDGTFSLAPLTGALMVGANVPDDAYMARVWLGERDVTGRMLEAAAWSAEPLRVELSLDGARLAGVVTTGGGPVVTCSYAIVSVDDRDWQPLSPRWTHGACEEGGSFVSRMLPPGDYFVIASAPGQLDPLPEAITDGTFFRRVAAQGVRVRLQKEGRTEIALPFVDPRALATRR